MNSGEIEPLYGNKSEYIKYFLPYIILIGFIVIAAIFSYIMLGAGFFATQKSDEVTYSGINTPNTDNLKIYQNYDLKYQFKYPSSWTVTQVPKDYSNFESVIVKTSNGKQINIKVGDIRTSTYMNTIDNLNTVTDDEILYYMIQELKKEFPSIITQQTTLNGKKAILVKNFDNQPNLENYFLVNNKISYNFLYYAPLTEEQKKLFDNFNFLN